MSHTLTKKYAPHAKSAAVKINRLRGDIANRFRPRAGERERSRSSLTLLGRHAAAASSCSRFSVVPLAVFALEAVSRASGSALSCVAPLLGRHALGSFAVSGRSKPRIDFFSLSRSATDSDYHFACDASHRPLEHPLFSFGARIGFYPQLGPTHYVGPYKVDAGL